MGVLPSFFYRIYKHFRIVCDWIDYSQLVSFIGPTLILTSPR